MKKILTHTKLYINIKTKGEIKMKNVNDQNENLKRNLAKACFNKYTPATNRNRIDKIADQMRYIEKMIRPEMKETAN